MKNTHIIGIIVIAVAIGAILATVSDSSTYVSFTEAQAHPGKVFHVVGRLNKTAPMSYNPEVDANLFYFTMSDTTGREEVVNFHGSKPQDFERSERIVLIGKFEGDSFEASKILLKCPSKYNNGKPSEMTGLSTETTPS